MGPWLQQPIYTWRYNSLCRPQKFKGISIVRRNYKHHQINEDGRTIRLFQLLQAYFSGTMLQSVKVKKSWTQDLINFRAK
jgi:hypothetical protein